jgi:amino acid transporter
MGIELIETSTSEEMPKVCFPLFYGIWVIIFSLFCVTGLCYEKHENLKIYMYYIILSLIVLIIGCVLYVISYNNPEDTPITGDNTQYEEMKKWQKYFFIYLSSLIDSIIMFFSYIFKKVYELDLPSYIL